MLRVHTTPHIQKKLRLSFSFRSNFIFIEQNQPTGFLAIQFCYSANKSSEMLAHAKRGTD